MHLVFAVFDHPSRGPLLPPFDLNPLVFFSVVTIAPFVNTCIFGGMYCVFFTAALSLYWPAHIALHVYFLTSRMRVLCFILARFPLFSSFSTHQLLIVHPVPSRRPLVWRLIRYASLTARPSKF